MELVVTQTNLFVYFLFVIWKLPRCIWKHPWFPSWSVLGRVAILKLRERENSKDAPLARLLLWPHWFAGLACMPSAPLLLETLKLSESRICGFSSVRQRSVLTHRRVFNILSKKLVLQVSAQWLQFKWSLYCITTLRCMLMTFWIRINGPTAKVKVIEADINGKSLGHRDVCLNDLVIKAEVVSQDNLFRSWLAYNDSGNLHFRHVACFHSAFSFSVPSPTSRRWGLWFSVFFSFLRNLKRQII